jgi:xylitol oxidase
MAMLTNWAGNLAYSATALYRPSTVEELQEQVAARASFRVLGSRHSFSAIADTPDALISFEHLNRVVSLDRERRTVTVEAGIRYGELCRWLNGEGFALHNMASLPHISVAGACATATHGSGDKNGNLATAVVGLELVTTDGELVRLSREDDAELLGGAVVGLGCVGVVARLTLAVEPAFVMCQTVYEGLDLDQLESRFDTVTGAAYSVSVFTDWCHTGRTQLWLKRRLAPDHADELERELFGAQAATSPRHPIIELPAQSCTEQLGVAGPWNERLPHFRLEFTPSAGEELQSEYFVPRARAAEAIAAMRELGPTLAPHLMISELRTIAADELWMSPCYRQDSLGIHFTWVQNWPAVSEVLPLVEARLVPLGACPHFGKLFTMAPGDVQARYGRLPEFRRLAARYDPQGKLRNAFVDAYIFDEAA